MTTEASSGRDLLDPHTLAKISSMSMRARVVVEGVLSGLHASPHHGSSVEFAEHKEYSPGDELRHIDWRLFAKSDKLYIKRFEHETNLRATLLLDASGSMGYGDGPMTKLDYARTVCASLAYLLLEQRDAVGLRTFGARGSFVPARSDRGHLAVLLRLLAEIDCGGDGTVAPVVDELAERLPRRGLVIVVSDGIEQLEPLKAALRRIRHRGHDVAFLQVLDADEVTFPFDDLSLFRSLENGREILVDPRSARADYLEAFGEHCDALAKECRAHGIDHTRFVTDRPLDQELVRYLGSRPHARRRA